MEGAARVREGSPSGAGAAASPRGPREGPARHERADDTGGEGRRVRGVVGRRRAQLVGHAHLGVVGGRGANVGRRAGRQLGPQRRALLVGRRRRQEPHEELEFRGLDTGLDAEHRDIPLVQGLGKALRVRGLEDGGADVKAALVDPQHQGSTRAGHLRDAFVGGGQGLRRTGMPAGIRTHGSPRGDEGADRLEDERRHGLLVPGHGGQCIAPGFSGTNLSSGGPRCSPCWGPPQRTCRSRQVWQVGPRAGETPRRDGAVEVQAVTMGTPSSGKPTASGSIMERPGRMDLVRGTARGGFERYIRMSHWESGSHPAGGAS